MNSEPLNQAELEWLDAVLMDYGNDDSVLDVTELDGFLTAIVSGPEPIVPSRWLPVLWGGAGNEPEWESPAEFERFFGLVVRHMNNIVEILMQVPQQFEALFGQREVGGEVHLIVEEWCFGYMRGVDLGGGWRGLPADMAAHLGAIALHGRESNFSVLEVMSVDDYKASQQLIEPAARALHGWWLAQRPSPPATSTAPASAGPGIGRNDPCFCGSGKKYKKCCLH